MSPYTDVPCSRCGFATRRDGSCDGRIPNHRHTEWVPCPNNPRPSICDRYPKRGDTETGSIGLAASFKDS